MRIEHIAMYVNDLERTRDFFTLYFGAKSNELYHNKNTGFKSYFLTFEDGARLEIMNKPIMEDGEKTLTRTGFIHLAFSVGSKEKVDELTERLKNDGYDFISGQFANISSLFALETFQFDNGDKSTKEEQ